MLILSIIREIVKLSLVSLIDLLKECFKIEVVSELHLLELLPLLSFGNLWIVFLAILMSGIQMVQVRFFFELVRVHSHVL